MSVYVRGKKLWVSQMQGGVRVRRSTNLEASAENRAYVEKHEEEFLAPTSECLHLEGMAELWLKHRALKPLTLKAYRQDLAKHILPTLGKLELRAITALTLKEWQNHLLAQGLSAKRVNNIRSILAGILSEAVALELLERNPLEVVAKPKGQKAEIKPLSLSEIERLLMVCGGRFKNVLKVAFFTGMRPGELIGLKWSDIDLEKGEIHVQRAIRHGLIGTPKTEHSKRTIPIFRPVREALEALEKEQVSEWVFTNYEGKRLNEPKALAKRWKEALRRAGLEDRVFYQTRHSFATMMIERGENLLAVSKVMGHASPKVTFERYAKATSALRASFLDEMKI